MPNSLISKCVCILISPITPSARARSTQLASDCPSIYWRDGIGSKLLETLASWDISRSKVLLVVTDNGFNMINEVKVANVTEDISETDFEEQEEELNEEGESGEIDDGDTEEEQEEDVAGTGLTTKGMEEVIQLHRSPCIAHTLQLVMKELAKSKSYCNLIAKVKGLVLSMMS
jgi:hypothetical protein